MCFEPLTVCSAFLKLFILFILVSTTFRKIWSKHCKSYRINNFWLYFYVRNVVWNAFWASFNIHKCTTKLWRPWAVYAFQSGLHWILCIIVYGTTLSRSKILNFLCCQYFKFKSWAKQILGIVLFKKINIKVIVYLCSYCLKQFVLNKILSNAIVAHCKKTCTI